MCGIVGIIDFSGPVSDELISVINNRLITRGPDAQGVYTYNNVGLGHRRLSIIDIASGNQPMLDKSEDLVIVFNGEIYNFLQLKDELERKGVHFQTKSDTEVILATYKMYGIQKSLEKLEGMFAFALLDKQKGKVFLCRDKFGEKPLYLLNRGSRLVFASEMKSLSPESEKVIDPVALNLFFGMTYIPAPYSIFKDIRKVEPGTFLEVTLDGSTEAQKITYYDLRQRVKRQTKLDNFDDAKARLKTLLFESVKNRMVADVPVGSFLSGGIDSSIVSTVMHQISIGSRINTFSVGFNEKEYDESERAEIVADYLSSNHKINFVDFDKVVDQIDDIILYYDEPFGDSSAIPSNEVAKLARKDVKVVLTGDCADELFGGYEKYLAQHYVTQYKKLPGLVKKLVSILVGSLPHNRLTNKYLRRIKKVINNAHLSGFDLHFEMMNLGVSDSDRKNLFVTSYYSEIRDVVKQRYQSYQGSEQDKGSYTDLTTVLEGDMLVKVDRMCMKNSLEARVPFLDSKIVEFAFSIPFDFKIKGTNKKYILKETFRDLLPEQTLNYKKQGFGVPVDYWLKVQLKDSMLKFLSKDFIEKQGIFNVDIVNQWYNEHCDGKENHKGKLWCYYVFQIWYVNQFNEEKSNKDSHCSNLYEHRIEGSIEIPI